MKFLIFLILAFSFPTFALDESSKYSAELIFIILKLVKIVVFLIGLTVFIGAFVYMIKITTEGQKVSPLSVAIMVLAGALLMNTDTALSTFGNTFFDKSGSANVCYIVEESGLSNSCFSNEMSGLSGQLKNRIEKSSGAATSELFISKVKIILGILQLIGFVYFCVGVYGLVEVSRGSNKDGGYGKSITTMLASSLIVDLPHTMQNAMNTLEKIGVNF